MRQLLLTSTLLLAAMASPAQTDCRGRGLVAVRADSAHVALSWRTMPGDAPDKPFDIYRQGRKLNTAPLTAGGTFFTDCLPAGRAADYELRWQEGSERCSIKADAPAGYFDIPIQKPEGGTTPDGRPYGYTANDASAGDTDGDGQYEIILKWDPTNSHDNAHDGYTGPTIFDCYRLDGTLLWRINLGRNIRSGAHYTQFLVYDFDGDGSCELMCKTADGTTDGKGRVIGRADADYRADSLQRVVDQRHPNGRKVTGRILTGPEYLTVFSGRTGEALQTVDYLPGRGDITAWGDANANRSDRYLACVATLGGTRPSAVFCRGYYTRSVIVAWDWDGRQLTRRWTFDTDQPQWRDYAGQGNHNIRVADLDHDGFDEIVYGSMAVDHDGRGLYTTGMGHGDAMHLALFAPGDTDYKLWDCHETGGHGSTLTDALTGRILLQIKSNTDVGRCLAADIDPTHCGLEMWSSDSHGIYSADGQLITPPDNDRADDNHSLKIKGRRVPVNFAVWWDGDLCRELLDHERVWKYDSQAGRVGELLALDGCQFNNGTKSNPCLTADILGDWREEIIARTADSSALRVWTTAIPTGHRVPCLMADRTYREQVAAENVAYNQPPHPGFYLGER